MENWHVPDFLSKKETHDPEGSRVLAVTSANIQNYPHDSKKPDELLKTELFERGSDSNVTSQQHYPVPSSTLSSNISTAHLKHLAARRARREPIHQHKLWHQRLENDRPYLRHPEYLAYRCRKRQDAGRDGRPIWPDHLERSFQNALVAIPPMGRKKKSQHGKPLGRNELISEWIFEDTGERRDRKQVSSHIQTLGKYFKGVPEWAALVQAPDSDDEDAEPGIDFYNESIADLVRTQRQVSDQGRLNTYISRGYQFGSSDEKYCLRALCFSMWVSLPTNMNRALHDYTRIQSQSTTAAPIPIENVRNWRHSFPDLFPLLSDWNSHNECDVILLKSSLKVMSDFPPPTSKLGISLELDFRTPGRDNPHTFDIFHAWNCKTSIYQHGHLVTSTERDDCHLAELGTVRPPFESAWWAQEFTRLTDRKRRAEDKKDDAAVAAAIESSRNFFRSLTIMQEIYAGPGQATHNAWNGTELPKQRMAILLWTFAQAPSGSNVGTTSWQKVIPPPKRTATNSPPPSSTEMSLPPFAIDAMIDETSEEFSFAQEGNFYSQQEQENKTLFSQPNNDEELCQDGFMIAGQHSADLVSMSFNHADKYGHSEMVSLEAYETFDFDFNQGDPSLFHVQEELETLTDNHLPLDTTKAFAYSSHWHELHQQHSNQEVHVSHSHDEEVEEFRHPLLSFDVNTHRMLQAQLEEVDHDVDEAPPTSHSVSQDSQQSMIGHMTRLELDEEAMREALIVASDMNDLGTQNLQPSRQHSNHDFHSAFESPIKAVRPPLMGHHSFAGATHPDPESLLDTPARNEFAHLIARLEQQGDGGLFDDHSLATDHAAMSSVLQRPRSQPLPQTSIPNQLNHFDFENHENLGGNYVSIKVEEVDAAMGGC